MTLTLVIPNATDLDYNNAEEVYAYHLLLGKYFERYGALDSPRANTPVVRMLDRQADYWLQEVERLLCEAPVKQIPELIDAYRFISIASRRRNATEFCNKVRTDTVNRWLKGDRSLTSAQIVCLLWQMIISNPNKADRRYMDYCLTSLTSWVNELRRFGRFRNLPLCEAYRRLDFILRQDLFAFIPGGKQEEKRVKTLWAKSHMVKDLTSLDTPTLLAYIPFERTLVYQELHPMESIEASYERLWSELATRPDLHPLYRKAIEIDLSPTDLAS